MSTKKKRILWAEDEWELFPGLYDDISELCEVITCKTRDGCILLLSQNKFDLLLLDLMLPNDEKEFEAHLINLQAGTQILEFLRKSSHKNKCKTNSNIYVIAFTARGEEKEIGLVSDLIRDRGEIIEKPKPNIEIVKVVKQYLIKRA